MRPGCDAFRPSLSSTASATGHQYRLKNVDCSVPSLDANENAMPSKSLAASAPIRQEPVPLRPIKPKHQARLSRRITRTIKGEVRRSDGTKHEVVQYTIRTRAQRPADGHNRPGGQVLKLHVTRLDAFLDEMASGRHSRLISNCRIYGQGVPHPSA